jgi:intracellular septation protein
VKILLDNLWIPFFLGAYAYGDIYLATEALITSLFAMVVIHWLWKRQLNKVYLVSALAAGLLGGITLYLRDPVFIKFKPTLVYLLFAGALLGSHFAGDRVLLARMPQKVIALPDPVWRRVNLAWALFFIGCALLNLYVADHYDEATWVKFKTFGFTVLMFVFVIAHAPFLARYLPQE